MMNMSEHNFRLMLGASLTVVVVALIAGFLWQNKKILALKPPTSNNDKVAVSSAIKPLVLGESDQQSFDNSAITSFQADTYYVNPFGNGEKTDLSKYTSEDINKIYSLVNQNNQYNATSYLRGFVYPIADLGGCRSKQDCYSYCEQPINVPACSAVSIANGYMKASPSVLGAEDVSPSVASISRVNESQSLQKYVNDPTNFYTDNLKSLIDQQNQRSNNQIPRVLSVSDGVFDNYGYSLVSDYQPNPVSPDNFLDCTAAPPSYTNPTTGEIIYLPVSSDTTQNCYNQINQYAENTTQQQSNQVLQNRREDSNSLLDLSSCFVNSRDFASDIQYCLGRVTQ